MSACVHMFAYIHVNRANGDVIAFRKMDDLMALGLELQVRLLRCSTLQHVHAYLESLGKAL
jgi:hypothetical protein